LINSYFNGFEKEEEKKRALLLKALHDGQHA
jgi:hypothetical protein